MKKPRNPWAICTAAVGRKSRAKYERCVMKVKSRKNPADGWRVTHDGETLKLFGPGTKGANAAFAWLHKRQGQSVDWSVRYSGYDMVNVEGGKVVYSYKKSGLRSLTNPYMKHFEMEGSYSSTAGFKGGGWQIYETVKTYDSAKDWATFIMKVGIAGVKGPVQALILHPTGGQSYSVYWRPAQRPTTVRNVNANPSEPIMVEWGRREPAERVAKMLRKRGIPARTRPVWAGGKWDKDAGWSVYVQKKDTDRAQKIAWAFTAEHMAISMSPREMKKADAKTRRMLIRRGSSRYRPGEFQYEMKARAKTLARRNGTKSGPYPFTQKVEQYRKYTPAELHYAQMDAAAAARAMRGGDPDAENWYMDDVSTIGAEIRRRQMASKNPGLALVMKSPSMLEVGKLMGWIAAEKVPQSAMTIRPAGRAWGLFVKPVFARRAASAFKRVLQNVRRMTKNPI